MNHQIVYLGFGQKVPENERFTLQRHYLPLGKIGGMPSWLNPSTIPHSDELICKSCGDPKLFLLQIYCTGSYSNELSFHRVIFVFLCRNPECSKSNDASNFSVFRCTLPRHNPFFSPESPLDPTLKLLDPYFDQDSYAKLCVICGSRADKKCSQCRQRWYCSRLHQKADWQMQHKTQCSLIEDEHKTMEKNIVTPTIASSGSIEDKADSKCCEFLFPEFKITMAQEKNEITDSDLSSESDSDDDLANIGNDSDCQDSETNEHLPPLDEGNKKAEKDQYNFSSLKEEKSDKKFTFFQSELSKNPLQILRYDYGGEPLLATDHSQSPINIPLCQLCGSERQFEFQLMPNLIALIEVDSLKHSIDWATVLIYTCSQNCIIEGGKYAREFIFKQDFIIPSKSEE